MATAADWTMKQGDTGPSLSATLKDASGTAVNLTGATVLFKMRSTKGVGNTVDAAATVVDAAAGSVRYTWVAGNTSTPGTYRAEFEVTFGSGEVMTFPNGSYLTVEILTGL